MSTQQGNNPVTGDAQASATQVAEDAAKREAAEAKATQQAAIKLDKSLVAALKKHEASTETVATLLSEAKDSDVWRFVTDSEGNPFKSWTAYVSDRMSKFPLLHRGERDARIKFLVAEGMTIREAAKATGASVGTASNAVNGGAPAQRQAQPGGDTAKSQATVRASATKLVTQVANTTKRVNDLAGDLSDEQLELVEKHLLESVKILRGIAKIRAQVALQKQVREDKANAEAPKPAAPKPSDVAQRATA